MIITALKEHNELGYVWRVGDRFGASQNTDKLLPFDTGIIRAINDITINGESTVWFTVELTTPGVNIHGHVYTIKNIDTLHPY